MMKYQIKDWCGRDIPFPSNNPGAVIGLALGNATIVLGRIAIELAAIKYLFWG
jgi:hypothetical protein